MPKNPKITVQAATIAERCEDAYSFDAYGEREWARCCQMLLDKGYNEREVEAIMRSKWTRWARDANSAYEGNAEILKAFVDRVAGSAGYKVADLVAATF